MNKIMNKQVGEFMSDNVISVSPDESIKKVFKLMDEHGIFGLPVVDSDGAVVGIVTETDLIEHFTTLRTPRGVSILGSLVYLDNLTDWSENLKDHCAELVKDIMTADVVKMLETGTLSEAIDLMADNKINRIPVVGEMGNLTGIITRTDIVHQIARLKTI